MAIISSCCHVKLATFENSSTNCYIMVFPPVLIIVRAMQKPFWGIKKPSLRFLSRICAANKRKKSHQSRQGEPCGRDDAQTARIFARRQVTPLCPEELYQKGISFVNGEKHKNGQLSKTARISSFPAPFPPRLNPRLYLPRIGHIEDHYGKKELQPYAYAVVG